MLKLGNLFSQIGDNMVTIEKYCDNNLKDSIKAGEIYHHLNRAFLAQCNQFKKPGFVYKNLIKPLCQKSIADYQSIYDVSSSLI